jgi:hypothetical protein
MPATNTPAHTPADPTCPPAEEPHTLTWIAALQTGELAISAGVHANCRVWWPVGQRIRAPAAATGTNTDPAVRTNTSPHGSVRRNSLVLGSPAANVTPIQRLVGSLPQSTVGCPHRTIECEPDSTVDSDGCGRSSRAGATMTTSRFGTRPAKSSFLTRQREKLCASRCHPIACRHRTAACRRIRMDAGSRLACP